MKSLRWYCNRVQSGRKGLGRAYSSGLPFRRPDLRFRFPTLSVLVRDAFGGYQLREGRAHGFQRVFHELATVNGFGRVGPRTLQAFDQGSLLRDCRQLVPAWQPRLLDGGLFRLLACAAPGSAFAHSDRLGTRARCVRSRQLMERCAHRRQCLLH
jgi:hypothetical protein